MSTLEKVENKKGAKPKKNVKKKTKQHDQTGDMPIIKDESMEIKEKNLHIKEVINIKEENEEEAHPYEMIDWSEKDLSELIKKIEAALPIKDNLTYRTRAEKLNWDGIAFKDYTGQACKRTWLLIQKRVRRFRLLREVLQDAKEWISKPSTNLYRGNKKKPSTPFTLYFEEQLKKIPADSEVNRNALKEEWRNMSDKEKGVWIDLALDKEAKYQDELKHCISQNPDFVPVQLKPVLTKEEKMLKERLAGKPIKPPNSAYALFSQMILKSEEIKKTPHKDRMKAIADHWKDCTDKEKNQYREQANHLMEQYKLDFTSYLESLPEEKRQEELQSNLKKRNARANSESEETLQKKRKSATTSTDNNTSVSNPPNNNISSKNEEDTIAKIFEGEPAQPPVSGFALFNNRYHGKAPVETAWKNLSKLEKIEYEAEVQKLKQKYIKKLETFLKSLSKEHLTAFSQLNQKREGLAIKTAKNGEESEESSSSCESVESSSSCESEESASSCDSESVNESSDAATD